MNGGVSAIVITGAKQCLAPVCVLLAAIAGIGPAAGQSVPAALDNEVRATQPGDIVNLYGAYGSGYLNQSPNQQAFTAGTVVYSDDPETVEAFGVLYRTPVSAGQSRVYLYHVNGTSVAARITAVLENTGTETAIINYLRKSLPPPSGNYISVGKNAVKQFYENSVLPSDVTIPPGGAVVLDPAMDSLRVSPNQLLSGKYDFVSNQPLRVTTLMLPTGTSTLATYTSSPVLVGDGFNRQTTTQVWGKENAAPYAYATDSGIKRFRIGDGGEFYDTYAPGFDYERQVSKELFGNFGIAYKFRVSVSSGDERALAILLNPRGGSHAGYVRTTFPESGQPAGQLVPDPQLNLTDTTKAIVCAKISLTTAAQTLIIEYMPPGASNLPVHLMLVPFTVTSEVGDWQLY